MKFTRRALAVRLAGLGALVSSPAVLTVGRLPHKIVSNVIRPETMRRPGFMRQIREWHPRGRWQWDGLYWYHRIGDTYYRHTSRFWTKLEALRRQRIYASVGGRLRWDGAVKMPLEIPARIHQKLDNSPFRRFLGD